MKKITLLLVALVSSVATWAATEVTSDNISTEITDGAYITLQCMDTNGGDGYYFNGAAVKNSTLAYANYYKVISAGSDTYYLQRVSDSKYVACGGNNATVTMADDESGAAAFTIAIATATGWTTTGTAANNGTNSVRFTTSSTFLNTQGKATTPKYFTGTGGYSVWQVKTYTEDEVNSSVLKSTYDALLAEAQTAYNSVKSVSDTKLITSSCTFDNTCGDASEGTDPTLLCDDNASTFWHTDWHGSVSENPHWIAIEFPEALSGDYQLTLVRRSAASDHVTEFTVYGQNGDSWDQIAVLSLPYSASGETKTATFNISGSYTTLKFAATATSSSRTYWHAAEMQLNAVTYYNALVPTEAAALKAKIDATPEIYTQTAIDELQAALDAYNTALANLPVAYTVNVTGAAAGGVKYEGTEYTNGQTPTLPINVTAADMEAIAVDGYMSAVTVDNDAYTVNVVYTNMYTPALPADKPYLSIGEKANFITSTTAADDNDNWYIMTQVRGGESPMYDNGTSTMMRAASGTSIDKLEVAGNEKYLVRFIPTATDGVYNIQFATGNFVQNTLTTGNVLGAGNYFVYNIASSDTHIGWNLTTDGTTYGSRVDNNAAGNTLAFWSTGQITTVDGNNDWSVYPVTFTDDEASCAAVYAAQLETYQNLDKIAVTDGATVIAPTEYSYADVNTAIDNVKAFSGSTVEEIKAELASDDVNTLKSFVSISNTYGAPLSTAYTAKVNTADATASYNTIIMPVNFTKPANWTLYSCAADVDGVLTLTEATSGVKNTPYVVLTSNTADETFQIIGYSNGAATTDQTVGYLTGVLTEGGTTVSEGYVLQNQGGVIGFYPLVAEKTIPCNHCYLTTSSDVKAFYFDGTATAIDAVEALTSGKAQIFDLQGRQLQRLQKGINIVNGKKVLVK